MLLLCLAKSALAAPLVTEVQPRHGRPGTRVVFTGEDLKWVNAVQFGDAYADWEPLGEVDDEGKFHGLLLRSLIGLRVILAKEKAPGKLGLSTVILANSG